MIETQHDIHAISVNLVNFYHKVLGK
jgi:hypothetical protein